MHPHSFSLACPRCSSFKECCRIRLYTSRVRTITCSDCNKAIVSSKWTCPCNIPWLQCEIHRRVGFACGAACAKGNQFAPRSRAAALHSGYISSRHAAKLGVLGEGDYDKGHNIRDTHHKSCSPKRFLKFQHLPNSALKEIKNRKMAWEPLSPQAGIHRPGV